MAHGGLQVTFTQQATAPHITLAISLHDVQFDGVLENVSQENMYNTAASEVVDSLLAGYNGTVFAYGQVCCTLMHST